MQQIADWLKRLGMSEYAERFVESDIDTSVLRDLTDQDLKELGVSLGHRRKMLRAIAELAGDAPTSQPELIELYKSGQNELKCGVFGRLAEFMSSFSTPGKVN